MENNDDLVSSSKSFLSILCNILVTKLENVLLCLAALLSSILNIHLGDESKIFFFYQKEKQELRKIIFLQNCIINSIFSRSSALWSGELSQNGIKVNSNFESGKTGIACVLNMKCLHLEQMLQKGSFYSDIYPYKTTV